MKTPAKFFLGVLTAGMLSAPTVVHAEKVTDKLDVTGWVWAMYREETTPNNGANNKKGLDIDEAEFDFNYKYDENWDVMMSFIMGRWAYAYTTPGTQNAPGLWMIRRGFIRSKNSLHDGSYVIVGQQGSPWMSRVEGPWKMNWLDGYTVYLQDSGFAARWEHGVTVGGDVGDFQYDVFYHTGNGFDQNGLKADNTMNWTLMFGYKFMDGLSAHLNYQMAGDDARNAKKGLTTTGLAVMYKTGGMLDVLAEYALATGSCSTTAATPCTGFNGTPNAPSTVAAEAGSTDLKVNANAYAVHLNGHFGDKWGVWARYVSGNADFANKMGGVKYGQWGPSTASANDKISSRTSIGPTYVFVKDKVFGALVYEMGAIADPLTGVTNSKNRTSPDSFSNYTAIRYNMAAFF